MRGGNRERAWGGMVDRCGAGLGGLGAKGYGWGRK